jgi:hypothetical protein
VIATPEDVLPLMERTIPHLTKALSLGIGYADDLQPDLSARDPYYWSHSARFMARRHLTSVAEVAASEAWGLVPGVPNSGIHLNIDSIHNLRVLRSLAGTVPHPGGNRARRAAWIQETLPLAAGGLPALSLLADWQVSDDAPVIFLSLPKRPWSYGSPPELHWRVPITGDTDRDLATLKFDPGLLPGVGVTIKVDPAEERAG